jgi:hypothetical protein
LELHIHGPAVKHWFKACVQIADAGAVVNGVAMLLELIELIGKIIGTADGGV